MTFAGQRTETPPSPHHANTTIFCTCPHEQSCSLVTAAERWVPALFPISNHPSPRSPHLGQTCFLYPRNTQALTFGESGWRSVLPSPHLAALWINLFSAANVDSLSVFGSLHVGQRDLVWQQLQTFLIGRLRSYQNSRIRVRYLMVKNWQEKQLVTYLTIQMPAQWLSLPTLQAGRRYEHLCAGR